ncbi:MAG: type II toxin-antitoxin system HicA family toxin [Geminicoccaceae bacterium]|nr:type II toxin-antitoxin system HicA family toxin [Geminicoccaceae bacterium]
MKTQEFIRRLRKLARRKGVEFLFDKAAGAGSHGRVWFDGRVSTLIVDKRELKSGTMRSICERLGVDPDEL